ncbi:hypothetical protein EDC30_10213 [Paucimonas lemoignei]|uniref:DNA lyase n=1 Tax=Paucimonas lemoignei TaxID=29443 RepID=A0A4R3HYH9_PAULE|nr:pyrimidine dimer DNA glycosylase/endonuclease V [Paucimonas lemoignei]TCS38278.1 hypothetical protein EDC30_10213 [Paucimonas lemoignei]
MRLWSLHPRYLDTKGLLALWREGLLAQNVLLGLTKGYKHHPQLNRFRAAADPVVAIGAYLSQVVIEATSRGYKFDHTKIIRNAACPEIDVTLGQLEYEWQHLLAKLKSRSLEKYENVKDIPTPEAHPSFRVVPGDIEDWERM